MISMTISRILITSPGLSSLLPQLHAGGGGAGHSGGGAGHAGGGSATAGRDITSPLLQEGWVCIWSSYRDFANPTGKIQFPPKNYIPR